MIYRSVRATSPFDPSSPCLPFSLPRTKQKRNRKRNRTAAATASIDRPRARGTGGQVKKGLLAILPSMHSPSHSPSKQGFNFGRWVSQLKRTLYRQPQPHPPLPQSFVINTGKKTKKLHEWKTLKVLWHDALSYSHASIRETICTFNALFISVFIVI